jgi:phenylpropionate dioxygenase-like ring-hydroxylating dioxygenase large terminal subunit
MQQRPSPQDVRRRDLSIWPRYAAAATGLRNYWYPVMWSRDLGRKPVALRLCGEPITLLRENGKAYGLFDQCPHRGIPLSVGRQEFPGTWTCRYHGWTFELETGVLKAALTDGPDSPICGKVRVRTYPVEERAGLIWV